MPQHQQIVAILALGLLAVPARRASAMEQATDSLSACPPVRPSADSLPPRPPAPPASGFAIGASVDQFGVPGADGGSVTTVSLRLSGFKHGGLGNEITIATAPSALAEGFPFAMVDMSLMQGIPLGSATLLARGGLSLVLGGGALPGLNLGLGLVVPVMPRLGVRLDAVYRPLLIEHSRFDTYSVGVGLTLLPPISLPADQP